MGVFLPRVKRSEGFDVLKSEVIDKNFCTFCGACASFCEHVILREKPELAEDCSLEYEGVIKCSENGTCYDTCPMTETDEKELENAFLAGEKDENLGIVRKLTAGSCEEEGQDGGIVTSLLISGLEKEIFECAIVAVRENGFQAKPIIATSEEDIRRARGTKYVPVPMASLLGKAIKDGKRKIAIIGTPCEIRAIRKIQDVLLREIEQVEITVIGLFCFENFDYELLGKKTKELLGVNLSEAERAQITKGRFIVTSNGKEESCKVDRLEEAVRNNCFFCEDFIAELADISIGSVGSPDGNSTVIIRSERGEEIFSLLKDFTPTDVDRDEIVRTSALKVKKVRYEEELPPILRKVA